MCRAGIGQGTGAVVAVAVAVLVGPLGAVHHEGIRAIGDGPHAVWVRPAVAVSVGTPWRSSEDVPAALGQASSMVSS